jgi:hypothetical protein
MFGDINTKKKDGAVLHYNAAYDGHIDLIFASMLE